jgi:hypothetical protein
VDDFSSKMKTKTLDEQQRYLHLDNMLLPLFGEIANAVWNRVIRRIAANIDMIQVENLIISHMQKSFYKHEQEQ